MHKVFVRLKYLQDLKREKRFRCCFRRLNAKKKGKAKTFGTYKLTRKLYLVYLEVKLQQHRSGLRTYKLKC